LTVSLPPVSAGIIAEEADTWRSNGILQRLWSKDPTVWADPPVPEISDRLGWLDAPTASRALISEIGVLHAAAVEAGITDIVLCGMGGSSLAPEVFASALPLQVGSPKLTVIDSTHPATVAHVAAATRPETTWYIVASKSGGTIETMSLFRYFWKLAVEQLPEPGQHFIAITDPGTSLETLAAERGFRAVLLADPDVGGRYSALTAFGLVPTGLIGGDVHRLLDSAERAADLCGRDTPLEFNPGFGIGVVLADRARGGVDKAQFLCTPPLETIAIWIEQLIAESTGKEGLGLVPIDGGPRLAGDRGATTVGIGTAPAPDVDIDISVDDPYEVAGVMFILEFATAVVGRCLGINPFDQPDVQLAKKLASTAMSGGLKADEAPPIHVLDGEWADSLATALADSSPSYISIQAYIPRTPDTEAALDGLRSVLSEVSDAFVTVGFGPRFLHSTGQLHKGGPSGGIYLQIVNDAGGPLEVPESDFTFNQLIEAQSRGDRAALTDRGRTVIAVNLGVDANEGVLLMVERLTPSVDTDPG
jgi:transaldolase/glucose-6-phosphate isomerase